MIQSQEQISFERIISLISQRSTYNKQAASYPEGLLKLFLQGNKVHETFFSLENGSGYFVKGNLAQGALPDWKIKTDSAAKCSEIEPKSELPVDSLISPYSCYASGILEKSRSMIGNFRSDSIQILSMNPNREISIFASGIISVGTVETKGKIEIFSAGSIKIKSIQCDSDSMVRLKSLGAIDIETKSGCTGRLTTTDHLLKEQDLLKTYLPYRPPLIYGISVNHSLF